MSRRECISTFWAGGIVNIPVIAHINTDMKGFVGVSEELSYVPLI